MRCLVSEPRCSRINCGWSILYLFIFGGIRVILVDLRSNIKINSVVLIRRLQSADHQSLVDTVLEVDQWKGVKRSRKFTVHRAEVKHPNTHSSCRLRVTLTLTLTSLRCIHYSSERAAV